MTSGVTDHHRFVWLCRPAALLAAALITLSTLSAGVFTTIASTNNATVMTSVAPTKAGFESANKLYEEGRYKDAAAEYQGLISAGQVSAAVYFNLGNALFKSGALGRAIAAYTQAKHLSPRDPDIRANLKFARSQARGPSAPASFWQEWLTPLTLNEWTSLGAVFLWLTLLLLSAAQLKPTLWASLRWVTILSAASLVVVTACLCVAWSSSRETKMAIVITRAAEVKHGPLDESQAAFVAHDGSELRLLDQKDQWYQVSAGPRRVGWIRQNDVVITGGS